MAAEGLANAAQYALVRDAMNRGDFQAAQRVYNQLLARSRTHQESRLGNHYTVNYLERFVGKHVTAGAEATTPPNRVVQVLPDLWRMTCDEPATGEAQGYSRPAFDDAAWLQVATYGKPLDAQGLPDRQTVMWYRTTFAAPEKHGPLTLFFTEVDGDATVYVNGQSVGGSQKKRVPFEVDITAAVTAGENTVAVRVDHTQITELFLGGIVRPVVVVEKAR